MSNLNQDLISRYDTFRKFASLSNILLGVTGITGWIFNIRIFKSILPNLSTMKFNTALVFVLIGVTILLAEKNRNNHSTNVVRIFGLVIVSLGSMTLLEYLLNLDLGIDQLVVKDFDTPEALSPGRMAFATALCASFAGGSLLALTLKSDRMVRLGQSLATGVMMISGLALVGYVYKVEIFYTFGQYSSIYSSMALHTSIGLFISAVGILCVNPYQGWMKILVTESAGGAALRRFLPPILVVPIVLGFLILLGEQSNLYVARFGLAINSILIMVLLATILWQNSNQLNRIDTERQTAEEDRRESELRYQNVMDHMLEGAQLISHDWRYLYVNETVAKQGRQSRENLLGHTMMEMYPGIEKTELFTILEHCMKNRVVQFWENEFTYPDGSIGWFELSIQPVDEGLFILSNDITERKNAEQRFHFAIESAPNAIILVDDTGKINLANAQMEKYFGYDRHELIGLNVEKLLPVRYRNQHIEHRKAFSGQMQSRSMGAGRALYARRKDGSEFPVEIGLTPIDIQQGKLVMATIVDITRRKHAEEDLVAVNRNLESRVEERTKSLNESIRFMQSLYEIVRSVFNFTEFQDMFNPITAAVLQTLSADRVTIILINSEVKQVGRIISGGQGEQNIVTDISYDELMDGLSGWVFREQRTAISPKGKPDPRESQAVQKRRQETNCGSIVVVPLAYRGNLLGTMTVINTPEQPDFSEQQIAWLEAIANQSAGALSQVKTYEELGLKNNQLQREILQRELAEASILQQNKMLEKLHHMTLNLLQHQEVDQLLNRLVELSCEFLDAAYSTVSFLEGDELVVKATTSNQSFLMNQRVRRDDAKLTWKAFDAREPVFISDYSTWPERRSIYEQISLHAVAEIPIMNGDQCIGMLSLGRDKPNYEFSQDQIRFGGLMASLAALILDNAELRDSLREQSIRDPLTGLFNRRYMEEVLKRETGHTARPLGIIMLDLDHFKSFNDKFSHSIGDALLREFGGFLQKNIRTGDVACRYGGEEFLLILPGATLDVTQRRAEFLRQAVKKLQVREIHENHDPVTISIGVASYPKHGANADEIIRAADTALYHAKQNGRDLVIVASNKT